MSLESFMGLLVLPESPTPAEGGGAISDDLRSLVSWNPKSSWNNSRSPTATDDSGDDFYPGSLWSRTDTTPNQLFLCTGSTLSAATWVPILAANQTITLTGNVTGSGTTSIATTIGAGVVTNAMLAGSIAASKLVGTDIATVGTITAGIWHGNKIGLAYGGTNLDASSAANGALLIGNGSGFTLSTLTGTTDQVTVTNSAGGITLSLPQSIGTTSTPTFGHLLLGTGTVTTSSALIVTTSLSGAATQQCMNMQASFGSDCTTAYSVTSCIETVAASYTITNGYCFYSTAPIIRTGSAITNLYGFYAPSPATANVTNTWAFFSAGTTPSSFGGNVTIGQVVNRYNGVNTVERGIPSVVASVKLTVQTAAIGATTLYLTTATGFYRINFVATVTTPATTSFTLGGSTGFQTRYTNASDSVVKTSSPGTPVVSAANTTGTSISGSILVYALTGTGLQYLMGYTSVGAPGMAYDIDIIVEAL